MRKSAHICLCVCVLERRCEQHRKLINCGLLQFSSRTTFGHPELECDPSATFTDHFLLVVFCQDHKAALQLAPWPAPQQQDWWFRDLGHWCSQVELVSKHIRAFPTWYTYIYVYIYLSIYIYIYVYVYIYISISICTFVFIYIRLNIYIAMTHGHWNMHTFNSTRLP